MKRIALSLVALVALSLPANAQSFNSWQHWNIDRMISDQQAQINNGIRSGSLNSNEASRLQQRLNRIADLRTQMGGRGLSFSEKQRLDSELDKLAEKIYRESNDSQRTGWLGNSPWNWARNNVQNTASNQYNSFQRWNLSRMISDEQAKLDRGQRNGSLTRSEARSLQYRLDQIKNLMARMERRGINFQEKQRLDNELNLLAQQIYEESRDNNNRGRWLGQKPWDWKRGNGRPNWH